METGDSLRIGICTPPGSDSELQTFFPGFFWTRSQFTRVNSLAELDKAEPLLDGKKYYLDDNTGPRFRCNHKMLYYKFIGATTRDPEEAATCGGGKCLEIILQVKGSRQNADCRERLYGSKMNLEKPALPTYTDVIPASGGPHPPTGYGAGQTNLEKVDGKYGQWSEWSECSATCGKGVKTRSRECDSPAPVNGGAGCVGAVKKSSACVKDKCPKAINGGFTAWSARSPCERIDPDFCSRVSQRTRDCTKPAPAFGGKSCKGATVKIDPCKAC